MTSVRIRPSPLEGTVSAQPSKSMAHRAIICAALSDGESRIDNIVLSDDIAATIGAIRSLGAEAVLEDSERYAGRKKIIISSTGMADIKENVIDCLESGSTARFIMPITRLSAKPVTFTGHGRLVERPFTVYAELFKKHGAAYRDNCGRMPITVSGRLLPGEYSLPGDISSQFVSGLLFVLPLLEGPSTIRIANQVESLPYIRMTLDVLRDFGIGITADPNGRCFEIPGGQSYRAVPHYTVEGDWSQAAFFCVMGAIGQNIALTGLKLDSVQGDRVVLDILRKMGAKILINAEGITFEKSILTGIDIDVSQCPDLVPAIAVAAALAEGTTHIRNAARLRIKESDRLAAISRALRVLGADITEEPDGLIIQGVPDFSGGHESGSGDHRIVMALAAASAACKEAIEIEDSDAVKKSYPGFWEDFKLLGGRIESI